jgi:dolichol-phosphate mannosyltransferase
MNYVLIPTYNEAENIGPLLDELLSYNEEVFGKIIVLDDGSPDGTMDVVRAYRKTRVMSVDRTNGRRGLGAAYRYGISWIKTFSSSADHRVIFMDGDGSHLPQNVARLTTETPVDLLIGSRYLKDHGYSSANAAPWHRKLFSVTANLYARAITGAPVKDLTSGCMIISLDALRRVRLDEECPSDGHAFVMELKLALVRSGATFRESPINFAARRHGRSKLTLAAVQESIVAPWRARKL